MNTWEAYELQQNARMAFRYNYLECWKKDSWAKLHVEAEKPISEDLRSDFYDELTSENLEYRHALEESVRWFGVRWTR